MRNSPCSVRNDASAQRRLAALHLRRAGVPLAVTVVLVEAAVPAPDGSASGPLRWVEQARVVDATEARAAVGRFAALPAPSTERLEDLLIEVFGSSEPQVRAWTEHAEQTSRLLAAANRGQL